MQPRSQVAQEDDQGAFFSCSIQNLDTVVITAAVHDLVSGLFVVEDRGAQQLKGIDQPIQLYCVIGAGVGRRRTYGSKH